MAARHHKDSGEARTRTLGALVAVMVVAGVVALVMTLFGGNSNDNQAATQPSGSQVGNQTSSVPSVSSSAPAASTSPVARATTSPASTPTKAKASTGTSTKKVVYTVKKGDNLTAIASWFNQRGYGTLYDWNKSVIGKNPDLIYSGQKIIVSLTGQHMKVSTETK